MSNQNRITKDPSNAELLYCQRISSTPATRLDVINLQEQLDMRLQQRQARETGICPVRRELFSQCFGKHKQTTSFDFLLIFT
jgi:hypothetical protein